MEFMNWIGSNWVEVLAIAGAINAAAFLVAKLTPTDADNRWVARIQRVLNILALNKK